MLFNSIEFGIFFVVIFILYFSIPKKYQWVLLLIASYYFYMSYKAELVVLILVCTLINYVCAIYIEKRPNNKKLYLSISLICSLGMLFFFKYFNFFNGVVDDVLSIFSIEFSQSTLNILLPMGISFYTLQTLGYTIDVYKGTIKAERNFGYFALFVSFFPQLVAGPIERANDLIPQLKVPHSFDYSNATYGLKIMAWGFFKKLVIADNVSRYVNLVYNDVQNYEGFSIVLATTLFAMQIYCDFSGYSDIARGAARVLGYDLTINFKSPYLSYNMTDFWRRWHITLTNWFKDYLYIPLGGRNKYIRNTLIVFGLSGFWHGANYTFIVWGLINVIGIIIDKYIKKILPIVSKNVIIKLLSGFTTFAIVCFGWIFFRANSMHDAIMLINKLTAGILNFPSYIVNGFHYISMSSLEFISIIIPVGILFIFDFINKNDKAVSKVSNLSLFIRWGIYIALVVLIILLSPKNTPAEFIYFEF